MVDRQRPPTGPRALRPTMPPTHLPSMAAKTTKAPKTTTKPRTRRKGPDHFKPFRRSTVGRPTHYEDCFCDRVVYGGAHGLSLAQLAWDLGTTRQRLFDWGERHPRFAEALICAREAALAWWETQGVLGMWAGKEFNDRVLKFLMTNQHRADYKERVEVSGALAKIDFGQMTDGQLAAIASGQHPYEVLAPKREVLTAGEAGPVGPAERIVEAEVVQATEEESVAGATEGVEPPEGESPGD